MSNGNPDFPYKLDPTKIHTQKIGSKSNYQFQYYVSDIDKPCIMFIPGFTGTLQYYGALILQLEKQFNVLVPSLPGIGESDGLDTYDVTTVCDLFLALLDLLKIQADYLCGHSMGGQLTIALNSRYAFKKSFAILPSGIQICESGTQKLIKNGAINWLASKMTSLVIKMFRQEMEARSGVAETEYELEIQAFQLANMDMNPERFVKRMLWHLKHFPFNSFQQEYLQSFQKNNLLVLLSRVDKFIHFSKTYEFLKDKCEVVVVENSAHEMPLYEPQEVAELIFKWCK